MLSRPYRATRVTASTHNLLQVSPQRESPTKEQNPRSNTRSESNRAH
ncbi:hypothetical protein RB11682 [Rhodopirellula baltica SH 1]|uniref:Uncharacterized protein n=1 Tax=Rhodopirellula baltica (strain DSM 10527 / NCIMB 13988 / SH1) TaxID=243090 RepID=Q7UDZ2_RHOBA|nr:hypothetical protein RB11682 [Rhodopirellula baltica SH 1]